jgi:hypothetical protein
MTTMSKRVRFSVELVTVITITVEREKYDPTFADSIRARAQQKAQQLQELLKKYDYSNNNDDIVFSNISFNVSKVERTDESEEESDDESDEETDDESDEETDDESDEEP